MGATYWGTRQTILAYHVSRADHATMPITMMDLSPTQRSEASAIAGGVTGFMTAAITRKLFIICMLQSKSLLMRN